MNINLSSVVNIYSQDNSFQVQSRQIINQRDASIPTFKKIVKAFVDREINLKVLCQQLEIALLREYDWGATGPNFLMELNKFINYPDMKDIEEVFRDKLDGLNAANMGQRIEQFYQFLNSRARFHGTDVSLNKVSPGNSAFIISLITFWLDRPNEPTIYYPSLLRGLKMLLEANIIPQTTGLQIISDRVVVRSDDDHFAVQRALASLADAAPQLIAQKTPYWAERFLLWITDNPSVLDEVTEDIPALEPVRVVFQDSELASTSEPQLTNLINEIHRYMVIDETVVRRIYYALLTGHIILTGPPGTGKTELAKLIPELLWQNEEYKSSQAVGNYIIPGAYTARLVTATDEWSVHTLIGGLAPVTDGKQVFYRIRYGHLTETVMKNWTVLPDKPSTWLNPERISLYESSKLLKGQRQLFRGYWLVIDEFNRASIDLALGEAITALGGGGVLRVPTEDGSYELPLPKDFRIIGTLNSFDRNYLNQISEALKRRFSFIEVLPPTRTQRMEEQGIVLYKALKSLSYLSEHIKINNHSAEWRSDNILIVAEPDSSGIYHCRLEPQGESEEDLVENSFSRIFLEVVWPLFEVIRIYRQLGTAQAIALVRQMLIAGITENYNQEDQWISALDAALCDTIADQLQVLLPDELDVLLLYINRSDGEGFISKYNKLLSQLNGSRRLVAQLELLSTVITDDGTPVLTEDEVERIKVQQIPAIPPNKLNKCFRLDQSLTVHLPWFVGRLKTFKIERGL